MTSRSLLCLALACAVFSGCSPWNRSMKHATPNFGKCMGATCNLKVEVEQCLIVVEFEGLLIVKKDDNGKDHSTHDLHWHLQGNYKFPENGIAFVGVPGGVFERCKKQNDKHFFCKNNHTPGAYKYDVRVEGLCPNGQPVPKKDPYIMND